MKIRLMKQFVAATACSIALVVGGTSVTSTTQGEIESPGNNDLVSVRTPQKLVIADRWWAHEQHRRAARDAAANAIPTETSSNQRKPAPKPVGLDACSFAAAWRDIPCSEVNRAISEAAAEFRIDEARLRRVVKCESTFNPFNANSGGYRGLMQIGHRFEKSQVPAFNRAVDPDLAPFNVYNPFHNMRLAARVIAAEGYKQWECKG